MSDGRWGTLTSDVPAPSQHSEKGDQRLVGQIDPRLATRLGAGGASHRRARGARKSMKSRHVAAICSCSGSATSLMSIADSTASDGLTFEMFFTVMVQDEVDMEKLASERGFSSPGAAIGEDIFKLIDFAGGGTDAAPEDGMVSPDDEVVSGDEMISRAELKRAFGGIPKFAQRSVEDFVYLFPLNTKGTIEKSDFMHVLNKLRILSHEDT